MMNKLINLTVTHTKEPAWSRLANLVLILLGNKEANFYQQVIKPLDSYTRVFTVLKNNSVSPTRKSSATETYK